MKVLRVVLPDGIHELTDDTRELLRLLDRAGVVALHRDDGDGVCFDILTAAASTVDVGTFNAVAAPPCPRD